MTKKVQITNVDENYPVSVVVTPVNPATGAPTGSQIHVLDQGQSCEVYVWANQALRIEEFPAVPNGGGGPGEESARAPE